MPKREKTPPPGDDEPKFLSIYNPFPAHATMDEDSNVEKCARWLACFVGKDNLFALFHKPSSPNVVIAEINPELTDKKMRDILGEHTWSEVFVQAQLEGHTSSRVFYSTFASRREVEKTGWKAVEIEDRHFKGFNPSKGKKIAYPYPATSYCEPPLLTGEVNALRLFRFLPVEVFPEAARARPQSAAAPIPGSAPVPPTRVVPGSAPAAGLAPEKSNSTGGKGRKGAKGAASGLDPTIRPTAPITRSVESSAKARAIYNQTKPVLTANMYDEDSDDDAGNYMAAHPGSRPHNWNSKFNDEESNEGPADNMNSPGQTEKGAAKKEGSDEEWAEEEAPVAPFVGLRIKADDGPLCPTHNKRCKPGICEWAKDEKRKKKRIESRQTPKTGQWNRQW